MSEDSIFTKIIKGELPSHKVYEDEKTIAFLPLHMHGLGHVLVVPKKQVAYFYELDDDTYQAVMATVKKLAPAVKAACHSEFVGLKVVGVDVPHVHVHVIAFNTADEYRNEPDETSEPNHDILSAFAKKLRQLL